MSTVFDLVAKISIDTTTYKQNLEDAGKTTKSLAQDLQNGLKKAAKVGAAAMGVASAAVGALAKTAISNYADFEQLVGGVKKLYGAASKTIQNYAQQAYKTSGLSANEYMKLATGFSATLINSLNGDTQKAAEITDIAMRAMSDNVNTFGTDIESVQNAFQGFAKQQYSLLDNLKLGYGGTKTEMERLIADANEYRASIGQNADLTIDSFADIVQAIQSVQEKQHIAGTTAKEAMTTISGAAAATKSAWQNLLTAIAGGSEIESALNGLLDSVFGTNGKGGLLNNLLPRLEQLMQGAAEFIAKAAPIFTEKLPEIIEKILPPLLNATNALVVSIAKALPKMLVAVKNAVFDTVDEIGQTLAKKIPAFSLVFENLKTVVATATGAFITFKASLAISKLIDVVRASIVLLRGATEKQTIAQTLLNAVMNKNPFVFIATTIATVVTAVITLWNTNEKFKNAVLKAWEVIKNTFEKIRNWFSNLVTSIKKFFGFSTGEALGKDFTGGIQKGLNDGEKGILNTAKNIGIDAATTLNKAFADTVNLGGGGQTSGVGAGRGRRISTGKQNQTSNVDNLIASLTAQSIADFSENAISPTGSKISAVEKEIETQTSNIETTIENSYREQTQAIQRAIKFHSASLEDQIKIWENFQKNYASTSEEFLEIEDRLFDLRKNKREADAEDLAQIEKERLENLKNAYKQSVKLIEKRVKYEGASANEEIWLYKNLLSQLQAGSEEYAETQEKIFDLQYNANKNYLDKIESLQNEYQNKLASKTEDIYNAFNIFERAETSERVWSGTLLRNIESQVKNMESFYNKLNMLQERFTEYGIDEASAERILTKIRGGGTGQMGNLLGLLDLEESQLKRYAENEQKLYDLAGKEAKKEISDYGQETYSAIQENLNNLAGLYETEAPNIGESFAESLANGILNGESSIIQAATDVASSAMEAAYRTLGIDEITPQTQTVDFASSALGRSTAGIINSASNGGSINLNLQVDFKLPDGRVVAEQYLQDFIRVANWNGTPIVNDII